MTILWSGPRLEADVPELPKICKALETRFGKVRFSSQARPVVLYV